MLDFLHFQPYAFGLDISDFSLKIAQLERVRKRLRLVAFGEFPVPEGVVEKGQVKKEEELAGIIEKALKSTQGAKVSTRYVVASLPEEQAFLQILQLPRMRLEEVPQAVLFEAENYIPYSIDTVYVDSQVVEPYQNHLDHFDVLLASLPRTTVDAYVSVLKKVGLIPKALEIESLSISRALIKNEEMPLPVLLIDIGAVRSSFIVFSGRSLRFATSISVSSREFTSAVSKTLLVDRKKAEEFKRTYGLENQDDPTGKQVFQAFIPALTDFMEQVKKYITYYESHTLHQHLPKKERLRKIILCGGGANLPGLPEFLTRELKMEVVKGNPWTNILPTPLQELPPLSLEDSLQYTTALGLALRGMRPE